MGDDRRDSANINPQERAVSGHPDTPPREPDHNEENDRELLRREPGEPGSTGKPAADGEGGSDQPGTTLPGYG